jgi:hypothetical protein
MAKRPSEIFAIVGTIDPDANATGLYTSDYVNMEYWHQAQGIVLAGILASGGTLDGALVQATDASGTGVKAITGAAITQMTTGDNDEQATIEIMADQLDVENGFSFVALRMTHTTAAGDSAGVLLGVNPRYAPADGWDLASVGEIVTV